MKPTEIIDRIAIVFNNLEHNGDTENANLLAELMNDIKVLHIADVSNQRELLIAFSNFLFKKEYLVRRSVDEAIAEYFKEFESNL